MYVSRVCIRVRGSYLVLIFVEGNVGRRGIPALFDHDLKGSLLHQQGPPKTGNRLHWSVQVNPDCH